MNKIKALILLNITAMVTAKAPLLNLFKPERKPLHHEMIITDSSAITDIAAETADFLKKNKTYPSKFVTPDVGIFKEFGITLDDVIETLEFIAKIGHEQPELLHDSHFLNEHFMFYRWHGDPNCSNGATIPPGWAQPPEAIITTQYRITEIPASKVKKGAYTYPLYSVPSDELQLTRQQVGQQYGSLLRFKYSRSEILAGALDNRPEVKILGWVTDAGRREFAMQGSGLLLFPHGHKQMISLAGSNDKKDAEEYWFAAPVQEKKKSKFPVRVQPRVDVTYAGDMQVLGFGKVILLKCWNSVAKRKEIRLGVLIDTGNAFKNNLSRLDMFIGYFPDHQSFQRHIRGYPHTARAYILIKKKYS